MKKFSNYLCLIAVCALTFTSCSKEEEPLNTGDKATLSFGAILNDVAKQNNKQTSLNDMPACTDDAEAAYVEIALYQGGASVVGTSEIPFRIDLVGGQIFTEEVAELELEPGTYSLEHFMVYDADGNLLWVAPRGGILADFVDNPLPLSIELGAGVKKYVDVSVICYDNRDVKEYGYLFFEIDTNKAIEFCIFGNVCPPPSGKHYPAEYSVSVWLGTTNDGTPIYNNVSNETGYYDNGDFYAEPLCFALPDTDGVDDYYFEITLRSSEEYGTVEERIIRSGSITDDIVRTFFDGENNLDYYHFREGDACGEDDTPIFPDPDSESDYYRTCAYPLNDSNSVALAFFEVKNGMLTATVLGAGMTPGKAHPQHIHGFTDGTNSVCPPMSADTNSDGLISIGEGAPFYGGVLLSLNNADSSFPMADSFGNYTYQRTFDISGMGLPALEDLSVVAHGAIVEGAYVPTLPVACGQIADLN